jgi:hypothetical protein
MRRVSRWFLILLPGCSMALSGPSPDRPRNKPPQCDTSKGMVFVDGLMAGTLGIVAASVASNNGGEAILPLIGAGVFAASAIHGNNVVNACNREMTNYDSELAAGRPPLPDDEPSRPVVAMQPAVAMPSQPIAPPLQPPQPQLQLQPPPQQQPPPQPPQPPPPQAQPRQQAEASSEARAGERSDSPWAAFWKESP